MIVNMCSWVYRQGALKRANTMIDGCKCAMAYFTGSDEEQVTIPVRIKDALTGVESVKEMKFCNECVKYAPDRLIVESNSY